MSPNTQRERENPVLTNTGDDLGTVLRKDLLLDGWKDPLLDCNGGCVNLETGGTW